MGRLVSLVLTALVVACAGAAAASPPLDPDPLDRGIAIASPSVYRLDVTVDVAALEHSGGRLELSAEAGRITTTGTAFAVAEGGWLAAADHVVSGRGEAAAASAYQQHLREMGRPASREAARRWVAVRDARPSGVTVVSRTVARSDAGPSWEPRVVERRPGTDLALLRIDQPGAPALDLRDSLTRGTAVGVLSYRREDDGPTGLVARRGELGRTGTARTTRPPGALRTIVEAEIDRGDSGAPAIDSDGRVRGMVVALTAGGGTIEPSSRIRALLGDRARAGEGAVGRSWRSGLEDLWDLDFAAAERSFLRTASLSPAHPEAESAAVRAAMLAASGVAGADIRPREPLVRFFIALALIGVAGAITAAGALIWIRDRPGAGAGPPVEPTILRPPTEV